MTTTTAPAEADEFAGADAVDCHSWSVSQLRSERRRLEQLLDYELALRGRRDDPVALEAELVEERHALQLVMRLRLQRRSSV